MSVFDFNEGDCVRVRGNAKRHAGRTGRIIGIKVSTNKYGEDVLLYNVMFSATEAEQYVASRLIPIRATAQLNKDTPYQTRRK